MLLLYYLSITINKFHYYLSLSQIQISLDFLTISLISSLLCDDTFLTLIQDEQLDSVRYTIMGSGKIDKEVSLTNRKYDHYKDKLILYDFRQLFHNKDIRISCTVVVVYSTG